MAAAEAFVLLEYFKDRIRNTIDDRSHNLLGSVSGYGLLDLNCDGDLEAVAPASRSSTRDPNLATEDDTGGRVVDEHEDVSTQANTDTCP
ncbi:hypothetical protein KSP40_PGU001479 [Platanthera guangdongensis]|uniref:Uncharacterized protein n=1 Tax=Platanthera guangdongensis TaxID=2320717 RepID=A0ABR2M5W0_9ASPA